MPFKRDHQHMLYAFIVPKKKIKEAVTKKILQYKVRFHVTANAATPSPLNSFPAALKLRTLNSLFNILIRLMENVQ